MERDRIRVGSFESRVLALLMQADRIFLFRKLFVALSMILVVSGFVFAQNPGSSQKQTSLNSSQPVAVGSKSTTAVSKTVTFYGEPKALGQGQIRSWVSLDTNGNPTAIGLTFSEAALSALPKEPPPGAEGYEISLALPAQAARTAFKHIRFDWNPNGHPPEKVYDVAHFDFHFYTITEEERNGITVKGDDVARSNKQPAAEFVPEGYISVPNSALPRMGAHWVNPLSQELHGQAFTKTFLYGSYNGQLIFAEPMITKAFLETKTNVTEDIKLPAKYAQHAYYPTKYSVRYDPITREYTVALEGMTLR
jgi:hypothetical protein